MIKKIKHKYYFYKDKIFSNIFWKNLFKNSLWAFFGDTGASLIGLIVTFLLIKFLGSYDYGVLVLAQTYMLIIDVALNIQAWKSTIQYGQKALIENDIEKLAGYIKLGTIIDLSTAFLGGLVALFLAPLVGHLFSWSPELIICAQIFSVTIFSHFSGTPTAMLRVMDKFNLVALQKFITAFIKLVSILVMFLLNSNISLVNVVIIYCISDIIGNILLVIFAFVTYKKIYSKYKILKSKFPDDSKDFVSYTLWCTFGCILDIPVNYFDMIFISFLSTDLVSVFKVFKQFGSILNKVSSPLQQSILPQFSELNAKNENRRALKIFVKIKNTMLKFTVPVALLIGITSPLWLNIFYGEMYSDKWYILLIYLPINAISLSYTTLHPFYQSMNRVKNETIIVAISNVIYMLVSYLLVRRIDLFAILIALVIQNFLIIYYKIIDIKRILKESDNMNDKIYIVIGEEFYNPLGLIRSLGEKNIRPIAIIKRGDFAFASKSKYISKLHLVDSFDEALDLLIKEYGNFGDVKPFVFTCDDQMTSILDNNYDILKDKFIFFNAHEQGRVTKYMNKNEINLLAKKCGINIAKSWVIRDKKIPKDVKYPVLTKAIISTKDHWKADSYVCENEKELKKALSNIKSKEILLQEYIDKKNELCYDGFSVNHGKNVVFTISSDYLYVKKGAYSNYMKVVPPFHPELESKLSKMFEMIGFDGIFSVEFLVDKNDNYYFLEINFRNSTWSWASTKAGMNLPYLWSECMLDNKKTKNCFKKFEGFRAIVEFVDFQDRVKTKEVSLFKWLKELFTAKVWYFWDRKDPNPIFFKFYHKITKKRY